MAIIILRVTIIMHFHNYTKEEKVAIAKELKNYSLDVCIKDYHRLQDGFNSGLDTIAPLSLVGIKFIEHFIYPELLNTNIKHGFSFYDFWGNKDFYLSRDASTKKLIEYIKTEKPKLNEIKRAKKVFNLYYGSVNVFRPTIAIRLYEMFKPTSVLDFTMGWGGRLVGASIAGVKEYIGIDCNTNLQEPYQQMCDQLHKLSPNTTARLFFDDCLKIDYTALKYDMVFTSPPYYNKELYGGDQTGKTDKEWNEEFYIPIFNKTWGSLAPGGHYCLNVPAQLYANICVPIFGPAEQEMELKKFSRTLPTHETQRKNVGQKYKEYIYIWTKPA
jgi:hypothetical protein